MKIMVMVDMQNDFIIGALGNAETVGILPKVCAAAEKFISENPGCFVYTMDTHGSGYINTAEGRKLPVTHCVEGTDGWKLPDELYAVVSGAERAYMIKKNTFGACDLPDIINSISKENGSVPEEIIPMGVCTDICVISNALLLKAFFPETEITVDSGCCAGTSPEAHERALEAMKMCHINII